MEVLGSTLRAHILSILSLSFHMLVQCVPVGITKIELLFNGKIYLSLFCALQQEQTFCSEREIKNATVDE